MADDKYHLSKDDHDRVYQDIKDEFLADSAPQESPRAIITGGQPGSGKSRLQQSATAELVKEGGSVLIDADELRTYHPGFEAALKEDDRTAANRTHQDAGSWARSLTNDAVMSRRNLVIDQTSRDPVAFEQMAKALKEQGYKIELRAMAVNDRISEQRIFSRYEDQKAENGYGRFSTKDNHDAAYAGLAKTVAMVEQNRSVDALSLYNKDHRQISANTLEQGDWSRPMTAAQSMTAERTRPLSLEERRELAEQYTRLAVMLAKPERQATPEERRTIDDLQQATAREVDIVAAKVAEFKTVAATFDDDDSNYRETLTRQGTVVEVQLRKDELATASDERAQAIARADLSDFAYLQGKPEQLELAVMIRENLANDAYKGALMTEAPADFAHTLDAAQLVADESRTLAGPELQNDADYGHDA